ncbi:hypothetical protein NM208_g2847 [Fusarium decemcellulare]|uniref:Uncharacterized protein n=1 Tax=Fusarium decemcellulare TaxID=57161 RepID=A0ACC1SR16_9HYPO|nr:hypothetical protein NM208_g2847 [Fusarium decemcellulare]
MTKISNSVSTPILRLPNELVGSICDLLPDSAIKNLRLTCGFLSDKAQLRGLSRVFISPSLRNLSVLRGIADHDTFRQCVEEIIWDDATLEPIESHDGRYRYRWVPDVEDSYEEDGQEETSEWEDVDSDEEEEMSERLDVDSDEVDGQEWFIQRCRFSINHLKDRMRRDAKRPDILATQEELNNAMSFGESFNHYKILEQQQQEILDSGADEDAFRYALQRLPRLKRVTVTPAAHGLLFQPLYKTPMIRDFPYGFLYPIPKGWLVSEDGWNRKIPSPWDGDASEEEKNQWRGFRIVTRILAEVHHHHVSELVLDNHKLLTGVSHFAFHPPTEEYHNLCIVLKRPGFRRVDLSIVTGYTTDMWAKDWDTYRNGDLYKALAGAPDLEHVALQTEYHEGRAPQGGVNEFVSLFDVFPLDHWTKLKHFGLSAMQVAQSDLVSFLAKLPSTLQSVELSFLGFLRDQGNYAGLLSDIRDKLGWRHRPVDVRVKIRVLIKNNLSPIGQYIRLDEEVQNYVYGSGPLPFSPKGYHDYVSGVEEDEFDSH